MTDRSFKSSSVGTQLTIYYVPTTSGLYYREITKKPNEKNSGDEKENGTNPGQTDRKRFLTHPVQCSLHVEHTGLLGISSMLTSQRPYAINPVQQSSRSSYPDVKTRTPVVSPVHPLRGGGVWGGGDRGPLYIERQCITTVPVAGKPCQHHTLAVITLLTR
ncbi:hypothetical protein J6590_050097 [Homalodisca vitripennis]|nr:hypothetical protein J6590_050097 [Homalodisca vitripennis]